MYFHDDGELIYPYIEDGVNKGLYDAGELDGTCATGFCPDDDMSIATAIKQLKMYPGDYIHVLGGDCAEGRNGRGGLIISNAEVLWVFS